MAIWQKHWSNTASDPRMQWLLTEMGVRGYGIYWLISERLTACEQGALLQRQLVQDMCSRQLNSNYISKVINNYYLFETDEGGYVRHHSVLIGYMNAHTLHLLRTGQLSPALLGKETNDELTPRQRAYNAQRFSSSYIARAGENKNRYHKISFLQKETTDDKLGLCGTYDGMSNESREWMKGFEEVINGERLADGKPIPTEAPARPSATAVWDAGAHCWREI